MPDEFGSATADSGAGPSPAGGSGAAVADAPGSSPAGESTQPGTQPQQGQEGPVPYSRFKEVNDKYSALRWAEGHDSQQVQQQKAFFEWLDADPAGAFRYVEDYLRRNGVLPQPQQLVAQAPGHDGRPQPDLIVPETGQKVYSAQAAEAFARWQAEQIVNERLSPIEQTLQQQEQYRVSAQAQAAAHAQLTEAETWPHFKGNEADILTEMERDKRLSLEGAYRRVVFPKLRQLEREAIVAETRQKASASTVNPGAVAATDKTPVSKLSFQEVFRREFNKRRG